MDEVIDLSDQFSISFLNDEEIGSKYQDEIERERSRAKEMYVLVSSFLNKLKSNPEANTIKWPDRIKDVETFEQKLKEIFEG